MKNQHLVMIENKSFYFTSVLLNINDYNITIDQSYVHQEAYTVR